MVLKPAEVAALGVAEVDPLKRHLGQVEDFWHQAPSINSLTELLNYCESHAGEE